jgi:hypothetical protein
MKFLLKLPANHHSHSIAIMAQIQFHNNPVKAECDEKVKIVTIWFRGKDYVGIYNHQENVAFDISSKCTVRNVDDTPADYHVIEPYEFPENIKLTLTGMCILYCYATLPKITCSRPF